MEEFKKKIHNFLPKKVFLSIVTLVSGSAIAQFIGILFAPVLSRIYTPEDFGIWGTLLATISIINVVGTLKYEMAIVLEKNNHKADHIQFLCIIVLFIITILSAITFCLPVFWIHILPNNELLIKVLPFASMIIFCTGLYNIFTFRLNREKSYKRIASAEIIWKSSTIIGQIIIGYITASWLGLAIGHLTGLLLSIFILLPEVMNRTNASISMHSLSEVTKKYKRFPLFSAPQNFISSISLNIPVLLLGYFFDVQIVGYYFLAYRIMILPIRFLGTAIRRVFLKQGSEYIEKPRLFYQLYKNITLILIFIIIFPTVIIFIFGPYIFTFIFGNEWNQAGEFARWIGLFLAMSFVNPPTTVTLNIIGLQSRLLFFECIQALVRILSLVIVPIVSYDANLSIVSYSICGMICNIALIFYVWVLLKKESLLNEFDN